MAAKKALDRQRETEENAKYVLADKENETFVLKTETTGGKKIITLKDLKNCTVSIPKDKTVLIKVFVENCTGTSLTISAKLLTSHVELTHCNDITLNANDYTLSTVQIDMCDGVTLNYGKNTFGVVDEFGDCNDRVYHSGVKNLTVNVEGESGKKSVQCDYLKDGAVQIAEASPEEYQFVTQILKDTKELVTDHLIRVGPKFLTQREIDAAGGESAIAAMELSERMAECEKHKADGNAAFSNGEYGQAILLYSMVIDKTQEDANKAKDNKKLHCPKVHVVSLANRSACFLKMGNPEKALVDAEACVNADPGYIKGIFRKGMALHAMGEYEKALPVLAKSLELEPKNKQIKQALQFCEIKLQQELRKRMEG